MPSNNNGTEYSSSEPLLIAWQQFNIYVTYVTLHYYTVSNFTVSFFPCPVLWLQENARGICMTYRWISHQFLSIFPISIFSNDNVKEQTVKFFFLRVLQLFTGLPSCATFCIPHFLQLVFFLNTAVLFNLQFTLSSSQLQVCYKSIICITIRHITLDIFTSGK